MARLFLSAYKNNKTKGCTCAKLSGCQKRTKQTHNVANCAACDSPGALNSRQTRRPLTLPPTPGFHLKEATVCTREQNMPVFRALHPLWSSAGREPTAHAHPRPRAGFEVSSRALSNQPQPFLSCAES